MSGPEPEVRKLALAVFAANSQLVSAGNELVAHLGLTSAWWQVLTALNYASEPLPTAWIARNMGMTRQAVQRIVDLLASNGLVEFRLNPHHRRAKLVLLTPAGIDAVNRAEQAAGPIDRAIAERLGSKRIADAIATLEAMNAVIAESLEAERISLPKMSKPKKG